MRKQEQKAWERPEPKPEPSNPYAGYEYYYMGKRAEREMLGTGQKEQKEEYPYKFEAVSKKDAMLNRLETAYYENTAFGILERRLNRVLATETNPVIRATAGLASSINIPSQIIHLPGAIYYIVRNPREVLSNMKSAAKDPATWGALVGSFGVWNNLGYMANTMRGVQSTKIGIERTAGHVKRIDDSGDYTFLNLKLYKKDILDDDIVHVKGGGIEVGKSGNKATVGVFKVGQVQKGDDFLYRSHYRALTESLDEMVEAAGKTRGEDYALAGKIIEKRGPEITGGRFTLLGKFKETGLRKYTVERILTEHRGEYLAFKLSKTKEDVLNLAARASGGPGLRASMTTVELLPKSISKAGAIRPIRLLGGGLEVPTDMALSALFGSTAFIPKPKPISSPKPPKQKFKPEPIYKPPVHRLPVPDVFLEEPKPVQKPRNTSVYYPLQKPPVPDVFTETSVQTQATTQIQTTSDIVDNLSKTTPDTTFGQTPDETPTFYVPPKPPEEPQRVVSIQKEEPITTEKPTPVSSPKPTPKTTSAIPSLIPSLLRAPRIRRGNTGVKIAGILGGALWAGKGRENKNKIFDFSLLPNPKNPFASALVQPAKKSRKSKTKTRSRTQVKTKSKAKRTKRKTNRRGR
ncbi:hypothetical protein [Thermococcus sp. 21S7]|uniref:hypothetical protein n=1 Tax=Thermococcus sp. 21S7 TaxID=1638221 RepID=UPI00143A8A09|nr:hypothetical protein [Thermococcus sp. 21S7]NJE60467.1 hypothetical protein [Thermococcus sp. 21S7]